MDERAREVLRDLYNSVADYQRGVLDEICVDAGYAWECDGTLPADGNLPCGYINVPALVGKVENAPCANCGAGRPKDD